MAHLRTLQIYKGIEFIFRQGHLKLWYTGRQRRKLTMTSRKSRASAVIRQAVIHCGINNVKANTPNDIANDLLCSVLTTKKRSSVTNIHTPLDFREIQVRNKIKEVNELFREKLINFSMADKLYRLDS